MSLATFGPKVKLLTSLWIGSFGYCCVLRAARSVGRCTQRRWRRGGDECAYRFLWTIATVVTLGYALAVNVCPERGVFVVVAAASN
jgi:hypothetical protein